MLTDHLTIPTNLSTMPIHEIADLIKRNWRATSKNGVGFAAVPYLNAMGAMKTVKDSYGCDDGKSIIIYALGNMTTWRGEVAKAVKAELNRRIK